MPFDTNYTTTGGTDYGVRDYSGYENNGTISDITAWNSSSDCISGGCYGFDGDDDYITVLDSSSLNITNEITVMAWINDPPGDWANSSLTLVTISGLANRSTTVMARALAASRRPWIPVSETAAEANWEE